jgi:hypothetical protein
MPGLNSPYTVHQEVIADIPFFNLAFDAPRPDFVLTDQTVQDAVITLGLGAGSKPFHAPFVFNPDMYVFKLLFGCDIARLAGFGRHLISQDMEHFLLHHYYFPGLRNVPP